MKLESLNNININSITSVVDIVLASFKTIKTPVAPLPPQLILLGGNLRPGLSASDLASKVISRASEAGKQVGDVFADGPNVDEAMEVIRMQEFTNALLNDAVVNVVIPPGISITALGVGNAGLPVISQGVTTNMAIGNGIIR